MIYKIDLKRDFAAGVYLSEVQNPIFRPLHTVYVNIYTGKGGELNQRVGETSNRGEYRSQSWIENTNMTECTPEIGLQSINSNKHLPQSPLQVNFVR